MPSAHVVKRSQIPRSFRGEQVRGMFDVPDKSEIVHECGTPIFPSGGHLWNGKPVAFVATISVFGRKGARREAPRFRRRACDRSG